MMNDLINRAEALSFPFANGQYDHENANEHFIFGCEAYREWLEQLPSAQQWIPCSERLPEQNGKYLVVGRQKAINILKFDGGRWYGKWGVVAWMPLPKPYREEVEDDNEVTE